MMLRVDEEGLTQSGVRMIENASQGVSQTTATLLPATTIIPAGLDEVSALAALGFNTQTAALQAVNTFAQLHIGLWGGALIDSAGAYTGTDAAVATTV
ncbi:PE family protein [Mycolicibacterium fortuitum]